MRQRLLLVAGWITAAVGSVLVASGAVTVAGGQVLDRPLRPLTAAEVAALPVVQVDSPDNVEPQASGGLVSTTGEFTQGSEDVGPGSNEPVPTGGSTADLQDPEEEDLVETAPAVVETASVEGGRAAFVAVDGNLLLLWATPAAGFFAQTRSEDNTIIVRFFSNSSVWSIEATHIQGDIQIVAQPEPLA